MVGKICEKGTSSEHLGFLFLVSSLVFFVWFRAQIKLAIC